MTEQPPPPAPGYNPGAGQQVGPRPAELLDRFLARLIDGVLLGVVYVIFASVIVVGAIMGDSGGLYGSTGFAARAVSAVLGAVIYLGYFTVMESSRGQTVGKMVMKLHTHGPTGGNPTMEQAMRRNIWVAAGVLGVIPFVGSAIGGLLELAAVVMIAVGINNDTIHRQAWHDRFAGGTYVVKEG